MPLIEEEMEVERWFVQEPFNPSSPQQILAYMQHAGHYVKPNKKSRTKAPSTDENALEKLAKKDQFYASILEWRKLAKIEGTYVNGMQALVDKNGRLHPKFLHNPSTWRLSCVEPNIQNVPDDDDENSLERRFRHCIVAQKGHILVEADAAGIEAVQTGWWCGDKDYVQLAQLGIHSYLTSHAVKEPADLSWPVEQLAAHLAYIKKKYKTSMEYNSLKRTVHLTNYGGGAAMMHRVDNTLFPSIAAAQKRQDFYLDIFPKLRQWQAEVRQKAAAQNFLGGREHPYRFKHWFWDVLKVHPSGDKTPGSDWNRVVAYLPQSTAAGNQFDVVISLMTPDSPYYVGDMYDGRTPLRALIHDSILAEVPEDRVDEYVRKVTGAMEQPIRKQPLPWDPGLHLQIGSDIKGGPDWGCMEALV
jgi:hypothetical protein